MPKVCTYYTRLPFASGTRTQAAMVALWPAAGSMALEELQRKAIIDALQRTHGHKGRAAALLGLTRFQLYSHLKRYHLEVSLE